MPGSIEKHMPGCKRLAFALDHVRRFVGGQPDPVADAVDEVLPVAGLGDHGACGAIDLLALDARADRLEPRLLRSPHDLVHLAFLVGGLADMNRAGRVRSVAVLEAAEVEHHHVAVLDDPVAHLVVRVRAVGAGAHDGEVDLRVPERRRRAARSPPTSVSRRPANRTLENLPVRRIGRRAGRGEPLEFVVVLDGPQHRERGRHGHVGRVGKSPCSPSRCIAHAESESA